MLRECFAVQVRTILATTLGVRMREDCPHCCGCAEPCLDALGSNAEFMGAFFGWAGAIFGLVEAQKSNRSFRFHFKDYVHRSHQFCTSKDIADLVEQWFATMSN